MYANWAEYLNTEPKRKIEVGSRLSYKDLAQLNYDYNRRDRLLYLDSLKDGFVASDEFRYVFSADRLTQVNYLTALLEDGRQYGYVMRVVSYFIKELFRLYPYQIINSIWLENTQIGLPSASGIAFRGNVGGYEDLLVLKVGKDLAEDELDYRYSRLLHEAVVGLALNQLRDYGVPNFAYTYGLVPCVYGNFSKGNQVILLEEYVQGPSLGDYYIQMANKEAPTPGIVISIICQLVLSLYQAYQVCGFRHMDLHVRNILIRELKHPKIIPYKDPQDQIVYLTCLAIPTLIDFGSSTIEAKIGNQTLTVGADYEWFTNGHETALLGDIFKVVSSLSITRSSDANNRLLQEIMKFWVINPQVTSDDQKNRLLSNYLVLPKEPESHRKGFKDLWEYLLSNPLLSIYTGAQVKKKLRSSRELYYHQYQIPSPRIWEVTSPIEYLIRLANGWQVKLNPEDLRVLRQQALLSAQVNPAVRELLNYINGVRETRLAQGLDDKDWWINEINQLLPQQVINRLKV